MKRRGKGPGRFSGGYSGMPLGDNCPEPLSDEDFYEMSVQLSHTRGPDDLIHHDCPMEHGLEPCRCGARALAYREDPS